MLRLRPYKPCDAKAIVTWVHDERAFQKWSATRMGDYPITAEALNAHYDSFRDSDRFFPMTAFDETGPVGHLILRYPGDDLDELRFGFIIVDDNKRGMGYGKAMLQLALDYAFDLLKVKKVTLGVFENNPPARHCYNAAGFRETSERSVLRILGEDWVCLEMEATR